MPAAGEEREASRHSPASLVFLVARDAGLSSYSERARGPAAGLGGLNTGFRSLGIIGRAIGCVTIVTSADGRHRLKVQTKGGAGIS